MTAVPFLVDLQTRPLWWRRLAVVVGAAVMAAASQAEVALGPVPLTAQTYALFVMAGILGGGLSLAAVLLWLAAAAAGLPVLAGGAAGWPALLGYTSGFLAGMAGAAWVCGNGARALSSLGLLTALFLAGHAIVLFVGYVGLLSLLDPGPAFTDGVLPFLPGAVLKSAAAALTVKVIAR